VSRDVNSLHHVTSITSNKMAYNDMSFRQRAVSSNFSLKRKSLLQKFTRYFSVEVVVSVVTDVSLRTEVNCVVSDMAL